MKIKKTILLVTIVMLFTATIFFTTDNASAKQNISHEETEILKLVNSQRTSLGIGKLKMDEKLNMIAQIKAQDMADKKYFSHNSPLYGSVFDMMQKYNYSYRTAGENIAMGQKSAQSVMRSWMRSSGHRDNILKDEYNRLGVGFAVSKSGQPYWVQIFAG